MAHRECHGTAAVSTRTGGGSVCAGRTERGRLPAVSEPCHTRVMPSFPKKALAAVLLVTLQAMAGPVRGQGLDPGSADALAATLRMLMDPAGRGQVIGSDPRAAEVDRQVQSMAGSPQLAQEVYSLAADAFADLIRSSGGDVEKMSATLERARTDPAAFAAMLSPQTLDRLRALSIKISDTKR